MPTLIAVVSQGDVDETLLSIVWQNLHPLTRRRGGRIRQARRRSRPGEVARLDAASPAGGRAAPGRLEGPPEAAVCLALEAPAKGRPRARFSTLRAGRWKSWPIGSEERLAPRRLNARSSATRQPGRSGRSSPANPARRSTSIPPWSRPRGAIRPRSRPSATPWPRARPRRPRDYRPSKPLIGLGDPSILDVVGPALVDPGRIGRVPGRTSRGARSARQSPQSPTWSLKSYADLEPDLRPKAIELLTQRPAWAKALLDAVARKAIPDSALNLNQIRKLAASKDRELADRVKSIWGIVRESRNPAREAGHRADEGDARGRPRRPRRRRRRLQERLRPVPQDLRRRAGGRPRDHPQRPGVLRATALQRLRPQPRHRPRLPGHDRGDDRRPGPHRPRRRGQPGAGRSQAPGGQARDSCRGRPSRSRSSARSR